MAILPSFMNVKQSTTVCALEVNAERLAIIAATYANNGVCPITDKRLLKPDNVRSTLQVRKDPHSC